MKDSSASSVGSIGSNTGTNTTNFNTNHFNTTDRTNSNYKTFKNSIWEMLPGWQNGSKNTTAFSG